MAYDKKLSPVYPAMSAMLVAWLVLLSLMVVSGARPALAADRARRAATADVAEEPGATTHAMPRALLPETRQVASPAGGAAVLVNPPPLLWPAADSNAARFSVRLSEDRSFPAATTIHADNLRWAMFNPHVKLADGTWYWQYGTVKKAGQQPVWSEVFRFEVNSSARVFVTPTAEKMLAACPSSHPRVLITAGELDDFRKRLAGSPVATDYATHAKRYVGHRLPDLSKAAAKQEGKDAFETKNFAKWASKAYAADVLEAVDWLVPAYLTTGDERFAREAVRWGLFTAHLDPNGVTAPGVSDFADGSCMRSMALCYDACYGLLSPAERAQMRQAMTARGGRLFGRMAGRLETNAWSAHVWQHILLEFTEVAFAMLGEVPDAEAWMAYAYELWVNRFPLMGSDDGGWAEGIGYFGSNLDTLLGTPSLWGRLTGADFFAVPWYRNVPYFHLYVWPPGSASDGFGDGTERGGPPGSERGLFLRVVGERCGNPYALWYAKEVKGMTDRVVGGPLLTWRLLRLTTATETPAAKPPADLPQARAFRDVGVVSMHTDLADASQDLMLGFRSSPYGAYNHAHACQNAFNLNIGGKRLFANSGYYIGYGDKHFTDWYTHTRGHNSILIDGKGQARGTLGYGWIARFLHGRQISYALGDASHAYGDAGLTRFRRHLVLLRPSTVIIYDELEADHPAEWNWLVHSPAELTARGQRLSGGVSTGRGQIDLAGSQSLVITISDRFDPPAVNWRGKKDDKQVIEYPNQWHATVNPQEKSQRMRFLAAIQVRLQTDTAPLEEAKMDKEGRLRVGPWQIRAELNAARDASLLVERSDGQAALAADRPQLMLAGKSYDVPAGGAILLEERGGLVQSCVDELPVGR
jgi:hypothetical protein